MRKFFLFALAVGLLTTSCDKNSNNYDYADSYRFATVMQVGVEPTTGDNTDDDNSGDTTDPEIYFLLDSKETFIVTENVSRYDLETLEAGMRLVVGVSFEEHVDDSYNYTAKLYDVVNVTLGENSTITTEEQDEAIADHPFSYIYKEMSLTKGYLNLLVGFQSEKISDVKLHLVENQFNPEEDQKENYLYLELRYDSAGEEGEGTKYERYVSFDMEPFREQLTDMDGIQLRVKTEQSDTVTIEIDSNDLFPSEELE